jgi:hypothetical protein
MDKIKEKWHYIEDHLYKGTLKILLNNDDILFINNNCEQLYLIVYLETYKDKRTIDIGTYTHIESLLNDIDYVFRHKTVKDICICQQSKRKHNDCVENTCVKKYRY